MITEWLGVLALGIFVGYLLSLGLAHSKPTLRAVLGVLGASIGGVPVAFLADAQAKWIYPLGLLQGLALFRAITLLAAGPNASGNRRGRQLEVVGLVLLALGVFAVTFFPIGRRPDRQSGAFFTRSGVTEYRTYYPLPLKRPPNLIIGGAALNFNVTEERPDGFVVEVFSFSTGDVTWEARGTVAE